MDVTARLSERAVQPLTTLDPATGLEDLAWLDEAVGDARVVAIGESAHYNREFIRLRHRLVRYLVERHGFTVVGWESGFTEGWLTDDWLRGRDASGGDLRRVGEIQARGLTSLMGLWTEMRSMLAWLRGHNGSASAPVSYCGIDLGGSNASLVPGLDAVLEFLSRADPSYVVDASIRRTAAEYGALSPFSSMASYPARRKLGSEAMNAMAVGLVDLMARLTARRLDYIGRTSEAEYSRAVRSLSLTIAQDNYHRDMLRGDPAGIYSSIRDVAQAETVEWALRHGDRDNRVIVATHNGHIQRVPMSFPGVPSSVTMGTELADRLGDGYLAIGTTAAGGQTMNVGREGDFYQGRLFREMGPLRAGSLDAVMAASGDGPFATDLRRLEATDRETLEAVDEQHSGDLMCGVKPLQTYDVVVHIPTTTAASVDEAALVHTPDEVQAAFARWKEMSTGAEVV